MGTITSIEDYLKKKRPSRGRPSGGNPVLPRARLGSAEDLNIEEILERVQALRGKTSRYLLDMIETGLIFRLNQIRRFGGGMDRRISFASACRVPSDEIRRSLRRLCRNPNLQIRRSRNMRMLHAILMSSGGSTRSASGYFFLVRGRNSIVLAFVGVRPDGSVADTCRMIRRSTDILSWTRNMVDDFVRTSLRELFLEIDTKAC